MIQRMTVGGPRGLSAPNAAGVARQLLLGRYSFPVLATTGLVWGAAGAWLGGGAMTFRPAVEVVLVLGAVLAVARSLGQEGNFLQLAVRQRDEELEHRERELKALNRMFQRHLADEFAMGASVERGAERRGMLPEGAYIAGRARQLPAGKAAPALMAGTAIRLGAPAVRDVTGPGDAMR